MQRVGEPSREMGQWRDGGWHESAQCKEGREVMLTYALNRTARESLYEQLYRALRLDIESGALGAGDRLPSKRAFAKHLGVSVVTVEGAYDQLVAEGYVRAVPRSGFYVQEIGPNLTSFSRISTLVSGQLLTDNEKRIISQQMGPLKPLLGVRTFFRTA